MPKSNVPYQGVSPSGEILTFTSRAELRAAAKAGGIVRSLETERRYAVFREKRPGLSHARARGHFQADPGGTYTDTFSTGYYAEGLYSKEHLSAPLAKVKAGRVVLRVLATYRDVQYKAGVGFVDRVDDRPSWQSFYALKSELRVALASKVESLASIVEHYAGATVDTIYQIAVAPAMAEGGQQRPPQKRRRQGR